ncbi:MAG: hypothetical protein AAFX79_02575 [Planctomycetota bacterium]
MHVVRGAVPVAMAGVAGLVLLGGCDNADPNATAIADASVEMRAISPGSIPPADENDAAAKYGRVASAVRTAASSGDGAHAAAARQLLARAEAGRSLPAMADLARVEREASEMLARVLSLETARLSAEQVAATLEGYDAAAERAEIDERIAERQRELGGLEDERDAARNQVATLRGQIEDLEGQIDTLRRRETGLRDRSLGEDPIRAAETIGEARRVGRQADGLEARASELDAEILVRLPAVGELETKIEAANRQLTMLGAARSAVDEREQQALREAETASEDARRYAAQMREMIEQVQALHLQQARDATNAAQEALSAAAGSARGDEGALTAAVAQSDLASLAARRAGTLHRFAETLDRLASAASTQDQSRLSALTRQFRERAAEQREAAVQAYDRAASAFRRVRATGDTREALQETADALEARRDELGGSARSDATTPGDG